MPAELELTPMTIAFPIVRSTPNVTNVKLTIVKEGNGVCKVTVSYDLKLSTLERKMEGLRFLARIKLKGKDIAPDADDNLPPNPYFNQDVYNSADNPSIHREVTKFISCSYLDEDPGNTAPGPIDEVYAQVTVTPLLPSATSGTSNVVTGTY